MIRILTLLALNAPFTCFSVEKFTVLFTAALVDKKFNERKIEYIASLNRLLSFGIRPIIVEACKTSSFFDVYKLPTFYPNVNNLRLQNKGVNEARLLQEALKHFQFDDEHLIVKMTGRYLFLDDRFFRLLSSLPSVDFVVRKGPELSSARGRFIDCFTGCFAAKAKYLREFLDQLDLERMEREFTCIEHELGIFLRENPQIQVLFVDSLGIRANIFLDGNFSKPHYTYW